MATKPPSNIWSATWSMLLPQRATKDKIYELATTTSTMHQPCTTKKPNSHVRINMEIYYQWVVVISELLGRVRKYEKQVIQQWMH